MDAEVGFGMRLGPLRDFGKPGTGDKNASRSDPMILESFLNSSVHGVHHSEIVGMNDQEA
jgi:hypothetical protein